MADPLYIPNLKTSDSELRAIRQLSAAVRERILPAFEITRSRVTKKLPRGSVSRRAEQLVEASAISRFILDVTTETDLMNEEMQAFFDEAGGYSRWRAFIASAFGSEIIPCLLYVDGGSEQDFRRQVEQLATKHEMVALRTSATDREDTLRLYRWALEVVPAERIIIIGSLYFLDQGLQQLYFDRARDFITTVIGNRPRPKALAFPGSSFPKTVGSPPYGQDDGGKFSAMEVPLYSELRTAYPQLPLVYSDYAAVHPIRYPTKGGGWVPRIDIHDQGSFAFSRLRQPDGGYAAAARNIVAQYGNRLPDCWGSDQIKLAATGAVPGRSPSFWISARINMWITQRTLDLDYR
ncbi:hypothetical protein ACVMAJ_000260 [Bradyrhizobium sp. USDA 4448]